MRRLLAAGPLLLALTIAACGSSATSGAGSALPGASTASTVATGAASSTSPAPATPSTAQATRQHPVPASSTSTGPLRCAQKPPYQVTIYRGSITCTQADGVVARFDRSGQSVQRIDGYLCQLGNAQTRPILFTCSSTAAEFTATAAVGPQTCPRVDKYRIRITVGQITCANAEEVAYAYQPSGPAVQRVLGYTCQSGNAQTRPTVFTCTSSEAEFTVAQP